ncbi:hypothetical protein [Cohnella thailandensis]|uniref:Uncharacterized protein n=1 Tax=Cohnella thailandensis TaxID=557557 RepID=A0A841SV81_9BACL|nr:hypothetical protein [Cohnella thailandensis]MBB6634899.1 hypothetical protein [Cohnella thailandensis]MBP1975879.1 hypothetical protein [Cohnella thailandensis]
MKIRDLAFVLIRLLALYIIVQGIGQLGNLFQLLYFNEISGDAASTSIELFVAVFVACAVVYFLVGWLLWSRSGRLVRFLVGGDAFRSEASQETSVPLREWYSLGLTLVGIVLVAQNVPGLVGYIMQLIQYATSELPSAFAAARQQTWIALATVVLKLAIAFVLIFRADGIAGLIRKIRELGVKDERQTEL